MRIQTCKSPLSVLASIVAITWGTTTLAEVAQHQNTQGRLLAQEEVIGDDGYNKTYNDESKSFKDRMKGARQVPVVTVDTSKNGFNLGLMGAMGAVFDAEPKSSGGIGIGFGVEPGYVIQTDSWSRLEFSLLVAYNSFSWKVDKASVSMTPLVFMPRFGWGTSLGNNLFGVTKLGFGMASAQLTAKQDSVTAKTTSQTGLLMAADYDLVYGADRVQYWGGFGVTHHKYDWNTISANGVSASTDLVTNINFVNLHGGVRLQF